MTSLIAHIGEIKWKSVDENLDFTASTRLVGVLIDTVLPVLEVFSDDQDGIDIHSLRDKFNNIFPRYWVGTEGAIERTSGNNVFDSLPSCNLADLVTSTKRGKVQTCFRVQWYSFRVQRLFFETKLTLMERSVEEL